MSKLISGKEAKLAWANGEELEFQDVTATWHKVHKGLTIDCFDHYKFRLKPSTITINGIECPAPFEPKKGDRYWCLSTQTHIGYGHNIYESEHVDGRFINIGAWRTEEEIKQVVAALRSVFKTS